MPAARSHCTAGAIPQATSVSLAHQLLGRLTSASQAAIRAELQTRLQVVLNGMDPIDREVLALRHFEELSNAETAEVLGLQKSAASNRYIRALQAAQGSPRRSSRGLRALSRRDVDGKTTTPCVRQPSARS